MVYAIKIQFSGFNFGLLCSQHPYIDDDGSNFNHLIGLGLFNIFIDKDSSIFFNHLFSFACSISLWMYPFPTFLKYLAAAMLYLFLI